MNDAIGFSIQRPGYTVKRLTPADAPVLQTLYEQCCDYALLSDGEPPPPTAALDEFSALPPSKTTADKYMFGLVDPEHELIALIESIRHYPDEQIWWLGLMMVSPTQRGQGIGAAFYAAFERWVATQGGKQIALGVLAANPAGLRFWQSLGFTFVRQTEPRQYGQKMHIVYVMQRAIDMPQ
jgi:GNAT superfamily N-acetyltransferase